ncbi:hypothetical protein RHCRD62_60100 [Rhodococcus sp. RD6.2]|nr:hypothetical protein RHCRD62_60100 [Rhodococcus sp. RD6.2]
MSRRDRYQSGCYRLRIADNNLPRGRLKLLARHRARSVGSRVAGARWMILTDSTCG